VAHPPWTSAEELLVVQGVIKSFDPGTGDGVILCDTDFRDYDLAPDALVGSPFRMLRQGQRVVFTLDGTGLATGLKVGSEGDMGTPGFGPPNRAASEAPS
jgi:CspA family cold shock protein